MNQPTETGLPLEQSRAMRRARIATLREVEQLLADRIKLINGEGYGTSSDHAKAHVKAVMGAVGRLEK